MAKTNQDTVKAEMPLDGLLLGCTKDRYKISYAAIRWAKEIKQKENLPDPLPLIVLRALREILTGKVDIKDVEKLPIVVKVSAPPASVQPTITLNVGPD